MQVLLGIDIGTSGCKALLIDIEGKVVSADIATYPLSRPRPGWIEQDPELWVEGARQAVAGALAKAPPVQILCIGLSGFHLMLHSKFYAQPFYGMINVIKLNVMILSWLLVGWMDYLRQPITECWWAIQVAKFFGCNATSLNYLRVCGAC